MPYKRILSTKLTGVILFALLLLLAAFHALVLAGLLPPDIVWGGRAAGSASDLVLMEGVSFGVTLLLALFAAVRADIIRLERLKKLARGMMWVIFVVFALSLVGNITSQVAFEKSVFTPLSAVLCALSLRLAAIE